LRQIARAVKETTNFGVIYAYLTAHNYNRTWEEKHGYFRKQTLPEILARNKYMWAIAQKEKNGMEKLDAQIVEWMNRYRGDADTWILPPKMTIYLRLVPAEKTDYYIAGQAGPDRVNSISGAGRPHESNAPAKRIHDIVEPFAVFKKNKVYITRTYHVDRTGPIDLMARVAQIGEYNVALSEKECDAFGYKSCHRSIRVYDETNDRGVTLSLQDFLDACGLFDANGDLITLGDAREANDTQDMLQDFLLRQVTDPQTGQTVFKNVTHFGDINEQFMSVKSISTLSQTVINSIYPSEAGRREASERLNAGMTIINRLNMTPFPRAATLAAPTSLDVDVNGVAGDMTDFANAGAAEADLAGATSWSALRRIATGLNGGVYAVSIQASIAAFVTEVETIASRMSAILNPGDNLFLDKRNAGPWNYAGDRTIAATFYENLLNFKAVPVFRLGAGAAVPGGADDAPIITSIRTMRQGFAELPADRARLLRNQQVDAAGVASQAYNTTLAAVNVIVTGAGAVQAGQDTVEGLRALSQLLRDNWRMTRSDSQEQLIEWLTEIEDAQREAAARFVGVRGGPAAAAAEDAQDFLGTARATILMAHPTNPTFYTAGGAFGRHTTAVAGARSGWELASRFDLTRPRDAQRAIVGAGPNARNVLAIGSEWNANEMPLFVGMAAADQALNQVQQMDTRRDDAYRVGSGLAHFQTVGQMAGLDVGRVQQENVWIPAAGGALAMAGQAVNLRIGNIAYLLNKISTSPMNMLQKLGAAAYLGAPVRKNVLNAMIQAQVVFPMNFIKANPHARYEMALGIKTKAGRETGNTFFGHSNFMLSDDATVKVHYGNYTHYGKSVIHNEKNVFIAYDIFSNAVLGGLGVRPYIHGRTTYAPDQAQQPNAGYVADMFVFAIPYEERDIPNPLDISGRFYSYMDKGFIDEDDPTQRGLHFTTAARYNRMWGFYNPANVMDEVDEPLYRTQYANVNRVCWQGAQGGFNPESKKFDMVTRNTGHWGPNVAVGVKSARDGRMHEIEKVPFGVLGF
jgi:hypothetical protein